MILWNRVLMGLDDSEPSLSALRYVAAVLGGSSNCQVFMLAVLRPGAQDLFPSREEWLAEREARKDALQARLASARDMLVAAGLPAGNVAGRLVESSDRTVGEVLLAEQKAGGYGTVVVGRRGISKQEEFLFGSVSSKVVHNATDCCVWVVA